MDKTQQQSQKQYAEKDGYPVLDVEMEDSVFCLGDPIPLRFRVAYDVKIREVRVELNSNEIAYAGKIKRNSRKRLAKQSVDDEEVRRGLWTDVQLDTDKSMQATFNRPIITNEVALKVTLNIPWGRDESVEIPISLGFGGSQSDKEQYDIIGF